MVIESSVFKKTFPAVKNDQPTDKLMAFESPLCKPAGDADYHRKGNEFCHNQNPDEHKVSEVLPLENFLTNASITKTHFSNLPFLELTHSELIPAFFLRANFYVLLTSSAVWQQGRRHGGF